MFCKESLDAPTHTQGKARRADGSPAGGARVKLTATANNGRRTLVDKNIRADSNGVISETVELDEDVNCLKFTVSYSALHVYMLAIFEFGSEALPCLVNKVALHT